MDPRLRTPALSGDLAALNRALDEGADPNLATPLLLRAGASINQPEITALFQALNDPDRFESRPAKRKALEYLQAVQAAGGFPVYARAHRSSFVGILSRGTRLPADVIPKIVEYWAHLGWYKYE